MKRLSKEQREVWSREESYWEYLKTRNVEGYVGLWHESFVGWPYFTEEPIHKEDIRKTPFRRSPDGELQRVDLQLKTVESLGENVVAFYLVTIAYKQSDGGTKNTISRIMHTWTKTRDGWVIISGMAAKVEPQTAGN